MKIWRAGLYAPLIVIALCISLKQNLGFAASTDAICSDGVYKSYSLWGPHGSDSLHWRVVKWKKPIRIAIIDDTHNSSSAQALKELLNQVVKEFLATLDVSVSILPESGTQTGDVVMVISDDLSASNDNNGAMLASMFRGANYSDHDALERSRNLRLAWHAEDIPCDGVLAGNTTEGVVGAYLFSKSDQGRSCVIRIFAAMFGVAPPPLSGEGGIPDDERELRVLGALKELYSPEIVQGMDDTQVREAMAENCK